MHIIAEEPAAIAISIGQTEVQTPGYQLCLTMADCDAVLDSYDPSASASPPAATCRAIARPILDAIRAAKKQVQSGQPTAGISITVTL